MSIITRFKKRMCRTSSIYKDGKLIVPAGTVLITIMLILVLLWMISLLVLSVVSGFITDPTGTAAALAASMAATSLIFAIILLIWHLLFNILPRIALFRGIIKKIELTCDAVVFPESVTKIYADIESLPSEHRRVFVTGLRPLMRKLKVDENL